MSTAANYDFIGSYNNQRYTNIDAERTVNLFEYIDQNSKKPGSLIFTSGLLNKNINFGAISGPVRGQFVLNDEMYVVIGEDVYRINTSLGASKINSSPLTTSTGYVGIDANNREIGNQIIFVDGVKGYIYDALNALWQEITDTSFPTAPIDVTNLDGFFVVANGGTNFFQLSSFNNGLIWGPSAIDFTADATTDLLTMTTTANYATGIPFTVTTTGTLPDPLVIDTVYYAINISATTIKVATTYANALTGTAIDLTTNGTPTNTIDNDGELQQGAINSHPGQIVGCRTLHRKLFLFSQNFTEVWENQGIGPNLPFRRNNSLLMEYGTPSLASIRVGFDRMFFLSQDKDGLGSVMMVSGSEANPISNRALDYALAQYAYDPAVGVDDAWGILIKENGLIFYRLNFTAANHTYVYNVSMSDSQNPRWHEEEVLNGDRHPAQTHAYFNGVNYYGDFESPILYAVDDSYETNGGLTVSFSGNSTTNLLTLPNAKNLPTGARVVLTTTGVLPNPLAQLTSYYVIHISDTTINLAYTYSDAINNIPVQLTDNGSGSSFITYDGEIIRRMRIGKPIVPSGYQRTRIDRFQLDVIQGQVDSVASNIAPELFLSYSKDGGESYGPRIRSNMGQIGQRSFRTVWRKLGVVPRGQAFVPKIEYFNKSRLVILGAAWSAEVLPQ